MSGLIGESGRAAGRDPSARLDALAPQVAAAVTNDHLHLIVNPTERCNLRCVYCYEFFALGKMSLPVVAGVLNLARRRAQSGLKTFQLEFFGGEPITAWDVVAPLAGGLAEICRAGGVRLFGGMTTNGVLLTRPRVDRLAAWGLHAFQVTLDGPQSVHDRRRRALRGAGSFDAVWRALQTLKSRASARRGDSPALRSDDAVAPARRDRLCPGDGANAGRRRPAFRLHFHALGRWGGPRDADTAIFASAGDEGAAIAALVETALAAGCAPRQIVQYRRDAALGESGHAICYAARSNAFVIRSDGRVAKCTVAFEDDRNTIGRLEANGDLVVDHARHLPWLRGLLSGDPVALSCPARGYVWSADEPLTPSA